MKEWIRKHCADSEEGDACFQWLQQVVESAEIPIHSTLKEKALGEWGPTVTVGVAPKLGTFQLMQPAPLTYSEFWRMPEASVRAQRDAARAREAVNLLGARMPVIGYKDVPRAERPTFPVRQEQEQKAAALLGDQGGALSNLPNAFRPDSQRVAPSGGRRRGRGRGGRGGGRGGRGASRVANASASIEEVGDEWAVGIFRVIYTGSRTPWQLGRIERRPATVGPKDRVNSMWYDRNEGTTTCFTRTPISTRNGEDKILVRSFGPAVTEYTNGRAQDFINITAAELDRINAAVTDWDRYEDSEYEGSEGYAD